MKILVTGGAGFVGSHLCEELSKNKENEVSSLDNYFTGSEENHVENVNYINGATSDIRRHVKFKPDIIFHLGEYSRVEQSFEDIEKAWSLNMNAIIEVLQFARDSGSKLIYSGSSTKFGDNGLGKDQSPYAWMKSSNSQLVKNFGEWFGLKYAITYFYNVYGGREIKEGQYATLIGLYEKKMKEGLVLGVVKPGNQRRNFTHIEDIVSALILIGERGEGDGYGIGSNESFSVKEIAQFFGGSIEYLDERRGNRMAADVHTEKIIDLGWKANHSIKDYIANKKRNGWM
tara:strand:+ start:27541 stop:28401 length:861 start_codon:yes stop_codon:yes gene_type:complete